MDFFGGLKGCKKAALSPIGGLNTKKIADCIKIFYALMFLDEKYLPEVCVMSIRPGIPMIKCEKEFSYADFRELYEKSGKVGLDATIATDETDIHRIKFQFFGEVGPFKNLCSKAGIEEKILVNIYDKEAENALDEITDNLQEIIKE